MLECSDILWLRKIHSLLINWHALLAVISSWLGLIFENLWILIVNAATLVLDLLYHLRFHGNKNSDCFFFYEIPLFAEFVLWFGFGHVDCWNKLFSCGLPGIRSVRLELVKVRSLDILKLVLVVILIILVYIVRHTYLDRCLLTLYTDRSWHLTVLTWWDIIALRKVIVFDLRGIQIFLIWLILFYILLITKLLVWNFLLGIYEDILVFTRTVIKN